MEMLSQSKPLSTGGWSEETLTLRDAAVVPPADRGFVQTTGVLDAKGHYCEHAATWRKFRPLTTAPEAPATTLETLPGRWIWGGVLWSHFGHFLTESTARLWALDEIQDPVDGILFVPKRPRLKRLQTFHRQFFDLMDVDAPVRVVTRSTRVESLIVPGQGMGLGEISAGTTRVRAQFATRFARNIAPDGPEKLYISRSRLGLRRGGVLGESILEERLREEGYEVFHPQEHSLQVQVARYRAARQVVAVDGSALHLLAMAMPKNQQVAVIARRKSTAIDLLLRHMESFLGAPPLVVRALLREWFPEGRPTRRRLSLGELNLPDVGLALQAGGFIVDGAWANPPDAAIEDALKAGGTGWRAKAKKRSGAVKKTTSCE